MLRIICRAKLHRLTVKEANLDYEGSLTLDENLMQAADLAPYEKVQVANVVSGNRFETYVIPGRAGSGTVCLNGAAAHLGKPGDQVIVIAYGVVTEAELAQWQPKMVFVDSANRVKERMAVA